MKHLLIKIITFSIPVLIIIPLVNYIGDPARIFDTDYEEGLAKMISEGKQVTDYGNCDERILQKELISRWTSPPDISIIGSSRTMQISSEYFPGLSLFNNSVSSACVNDIIGIYQLYKDKKSVPKKIIIGIDPLIFDANNKDERWQSLAEYYYKFKNINYNGNSMLYKYNQLFSFTYFQSSIEQIKQKSKGIRPKETDSKFNNRKTKLNDGSQVYGKGIREISINELEKKVNYFLSYDIKSYERFNSISETIWNDFEILIQDMNNNNVEVEFFLAPYHPKIYKEFSSRCQSVLDVENKIIVFANKNDIMLHGSYNPNKNNLNENYFYDGIHAKEKSIPEILEK